MKRSVLAIVLLTSAALGAQAAPDFSGVFLLSALKGTNENWKSVPPQILEVKQSPDAISITVMLNGEAAEIHASLNGQKSGDLQGQVKGNNLILSAGEIPKQPNGIDRRVEEKWELSTDSRKLTIRRKVQMGTAPDLNETETYDRQPSLEAAQAAASSAAGRCDQTFTQRLPAGVEPSPSNAVSLGRTQFLQLTRCVSFSANLSGNFLRGLRRSGDATHATFRINGKQISEFSEDVDLTVELSNLCLTGQGLLRPVILTGAADHFQNLRFLARWMGTEQRELGELKSELTQQYWPEFEAPWTYYRMPIPAKGIPLTDTLEVTIFTSDAKQLGCIRGHL